MNENIDKNFETVVLGALLHDIGKFLERAGLRDKIGSDKIYPHPRIGAHYLKNSLNLEDDIVNLCLFHHNPKYAPKEVKYLCKILQLADWLSSGEREESEKKVDESREYQHLISIFGRVGFSEKTGKIREEKINYGKSFRYNFVPLTFNNLMFPEKELTQNLKIKHLFHGITNKENPNFDKFPCFDKEIKEIDLHNPTQLLGFIQKYWWCLPSATWWEKGKYLPDVSLYDHSKTTCAIASCLYKQGINENELNDLIKNPPWNKEKNDSWEKRKLFSLIHGDLSGIQKFIYTIKTKSAAKSLKGRSLMVVLLQRFIAEHILRQLDLPLTNLIYSGGGHFYILAPNNLCGYGLKEIRKEINEKLFEEFGTKLYLALDSVNLCPENFIGGNFANKWKEVAEKTSKLKGEKYREFGYKIFEPFDMGGKEEICEVCGKEGKLEPSEDNKICSSCKQFKEISGYLKQIQNEGYFEISKIKKEFKILNKFKTILNGKVFLNPSQGVPFFSIPMGIPIKDGRIKDFTELAEEAEEDTGTKKIAILKMDVDNLGKIFTRGLNNATISRMSTLSGMLSLFFEGYINEFIKEKYKGEVYLIYAGGDDTFVVGRWDKLIDFTYDVYQKFRKFTCNNPDITLSAGIVFVSSTYPLSRAAEMAENALDEAKRFEQGKHEKNSICIFNYPLKWCIDADKSINDFEMVKQIEDILVKCINDGAQKQLIQRVKISARGLKKMLRGGGINVNDYWRLKYYFHRNYKNKNGEWKPSEIGELITVLYEDIIKTHIFNKTKDKNYDINLIPIAARIAELKTRGEKNE